jgi:hypothetical protein
MTDRRRAIEQVEHELAVAEQAVHECLAGLFDPPAVKDRIEMWASELVKCEDEYSTAMSDGNVPRAAHVAANTPQRYLQTPRTWSTFSDLGPTALFEYACALVDAGSAPGSGVECAVVAVDADRLDVLETWVLGGGLSPTIELARALHSKTVAAEAERRFITLASLAVAACERVPPPRKTAAMSPDVAAAAADAYREAGVIGMELLVRRGRVRAALTFGAARRVTVAVCTAVALRVGSIPLAIALGRAAAHNVEGLDWVAKLLPAPTTDSVTVWQQWNASTERQQQVVQAREAHATAFAEELVRLCVVDLQL